MRRASVLILLASVFFTIAMPAAAGGGGCHGAKTEGETTTVDMTYNCFGPTVTRVAPGDTVTFVNRDSWAHTVTGSGLEWGSTASLGAGQSLSHRFPKPGTYPYVCLLHPGMIGTVVVGHAPGDAAAAAATPTGFTGRAVVAAPPVVDAASSPTAGWVVAAAVAGLAVGWTASSLGRRTD